MALASAALLVGCALQLHRPRPADTRGSLVGSNCYIASPMRRAAALALNAARGAHGRSFDGARTAASQPPAPGSDRRPKHPIPEPRPLSAYPPPPDPAARFAVKPTAAPKPAPDPLCPEAATAAVHWSATSEEGLGELKALMAVAAPRALVAAAHAVATAPRRVPRAAVDAIGSALARRMADDVGALVSATQAFASVGLFSPELKSALSAALRAGGPNVNGHNIARALRAFSALAAWDDGVVGVAVKRLSSDPSAFDAADVADIAQAATHLGAFSQELTAAITAAVPSLAARASAEDLAHLASALAAARAAADSPVMAAVADRVTADAASFGPVGLPRALRALVRAGFADAPMLDAAAAAATTLAPHMSNTGLARVARAYADVGAPAPAACDAVEAEAAARLAAGRLPRGAAADILDAFNILGHPAHWLTAAVAGQDQKGEEGERGGGEEQAAGQGKEAEKGGGP